MNPVSKVLQQGPHGVDPGVRGRITAHLLLVDFVIDYILYIVILILMCRCLTLRVRSGIHSVSACSYSLFPANTSAVIQAELPDHHSSDRMKLNVSDSMNT